MPHPGWATVAESEWLESNRASFTDAQQKSTTAAWFPVKYTEFFTKFPPKPDEKAVAIAGSRDAAVDALRNKRKSQIYWWFYNHCRITAPGTGGQRVLNLSKAKRMMQPYQAYMVLCGHRVLPLIEALWQGYNEIPMPPGEPRQSRLGFQTERAKEMLMQEPGEVQAEVEAFRRDPDAESLQFVDDLESTPEHRKARALATGIAAIPRTLQLACKNLQDATGFVASIFVGGPDPRTGQFLNYIWHEGKTDLGYKWDQSTPEWMTIKADWEAFTLRCFGPNAARDLAAAYANPKPADATTAAEGAQVATTSGEANAATTAADARAATTDARAGDTRNREPSPEFVDSPNNPPMNLIGDVLDQPEEEGGSGDESSESEVEVIDAAKFERDRLANIAGNKALLKALDLKATGVPSGGRPKPRPKPRKLKTKAVVDEDDFVPDDEQAVHVDSRRKSKRVGASVTAISDAPPPSSSASTTTTTPSASPTTCAVPPSLPVATPTTASTNAAVPPTATVVPEAHGAATRTDGTSGDVSHSPAHGAPGACSLGQDPASLISAPLPAGGPMTDHAKASPSVVTVRSAASAQDAPQVSVAGEPITPVSAQDSIAPNTQVAVDNEAHTAPSVQTDQVPSVITQADPVPPAVSSAGALGCDVPPQASAASPAAPSASTATQQLGAPAPSAQDSVPPSQAAPRSSAVSPTEPNVFTPVNGLPEHVREHQAFIKGVSERAEWQALYDKWLALEIALGDVDSKKKKNQLSTVQRPNEVAVWFRYGRMPNKMPSINDPAAYGVAWKAWWAELQPTWRGKTWPLPRTSGDWTDLQRGGKNGLFVAILALAWWYAEAAESGDIKEISEVVSEVMFALGEICGGVGGRKHDAPSDPIDDSRPTKRRRRR